MTAGQNRIPVNLDYAASTPMRAEARLAQAAQTLGETFEPAYGKDTNAADALAALLASKGYDDVTVTVKAAAGDAKASIDADGTIHYYFDAGMSSRSSYFYATFVLSLDGASVEKEVYVHITWDLARAQAVLQAELDRITLPTEPVTSLTLPRYPVKEGIDPSQVDYSKYDNFNTWATVTWTSANDTINMLNQGEISVAVLLDYSYTTAKNANPDYIWVDPAEGSFSGYNMLNIVKGCENKELAEAFIDFYLSRFIQMYSDVVMEVGKKYFEQLIDKMKEEKGVHFDVELTAEQAANFTYGEDMIANLKLPDWNVIAANQANWIASWNAIFSVK